MAQFQWQTWISEMFHIMRSILFTCSLLQDISDFNWLKCWVLQTHYITPILKAFWKNKAILILVILTNLINHFYNSLSSKLPITSLAIAVLKLTSQKLWMRCPLLTVTVHVKMQMLNWFSSSHLVSLEATNRTALKNFKSLSNKSLPVLLELFLYSTDDFSFAAVLQFLTCYIFVSEYKKCLLTDHKVSL